MWNGISKNNFKKYFLSKYLMAKCFVCFPLNCLTIVENSRLPLPSHFFPLIWQVRKCFYLRWESGRKFSSSPERQNWRKPKLLENRLISSQLAMSEEKNKKEKMTIWFLHKQLSWHQMLASSSSEDENSAREISAISTSWYQRCNILKIYFINKKIWSVWRWVGFRQKTTKVLLCRSCVTH